MSEDVSNVEFVDIPDQSILESQGSGGVSGSPFAIKIVDGNRDVKFYAPDMFQLAAKYAADNPDVSGQGTNYTSMSDFVRHYNEFGKNEGREFYNPEMFNFSNVGTLSEKGQQDDTAENQFNPYFKGKIEEKLTFQNFLYIFFPLHFHSQVRPKPQHLFVEERLFSPELPYSL